MNSAIFQGRVLSDAEFLDMLDYTLDLVGEFEAVAAKACESLRKNAVLVEA